MRITPGPDGKLLKQFVSSHIRMWKGASRHWKRTPGRGTCTCDPPDPRRRPLSPQDFEFELDGMADVTIAWRRRRAGQGTGIRTGVGRPLGDSGRRSSRLPPRSRRGVTAGVRGALVQPVDPAPFQRVVSQLKTSRSPQGVATQRGWPREHGRGSAASGFVGRTEATRDAFAPSLHVTAFDPHSPIPAFVSFQTPTSSQRPR